MADDGFRTLVGLEAEQTAEGHARVTLQADERHFNAHGTVHGGVIATLLDVAMGTAVASAPGDDSERPVTIEMKVTYLEPARSGALVATAKVHKRGKRITIVEAELEQDDEMISHAIGTFTTIS
jgi:uncharacterized protein (TIGR00369 family)